MDKTVVNRGHNRLTDAEYRGIRDFIAGKTGLNLLPEKDGDLRGLLTTRLSEKYPDLTFRQYFERLHLEGDGGRELKYLVSRLTVGETHFFRNKPQINALRNVILPDIIKRKSMGNRTLKLWSAGCSTGEEPYTLAMILRDLLPDIASWDVLILATDINGEALSAARRGTYRDWSFRDVDDYYLRRYFSRDEGGWNISRELESMISFRYLNLADDHYPAAVTKTDDLDLIICRNVMIYFTVELSLQVTERFFRCLRDGGYLIVGHSEHSEMVCPKFKRKLHEPAIYYQKGGAGTPWERAIKLRFRGSGDVSRNTFVQVDRPQKVRREARPRETEETAIFDEAAALYRKRMTDEAGDLFRKIVRINGSNKRARYMLAHIAADSGDIETAEREGLEILRLDPLHLKAMYLLSLVYRIKGQPEKEIEHLKKTVYINRFFVMGHFQMGVYYLNEGNDGLARRSLNNVLDIIGNADPSHVIEGVDGLTVLGLRKSVLEMYPGDVPEEYVHE